MSERNLVVTPDIPVSEQKKYAGKYVALVDGKIVAWGNTSVEAFGKAKKLYPDKKSEEIELLYIPEPGFLAL